MTHEQRHADEGFNEMDPHGYEGHGQHASHVIVGPFTLRLILAILLFCTFLTVAVAQAESWAQTYFNIVLPHWVNVFGFISIALVKAVLVAMFFMQLKYDNPINSMVMAFALFCLMVFIGFTGIDLFTRGSVYAFKQGQQTPGGTGIAGGPQYLVAKEKFKTDHKLDDAAFDRLEHAFAHVEHAPHTWYPADANSPNRSRPRTGRSNALSLESAPAPEGRDGPHKAPAPEQPAH